LCFEKLSDLQKITVSSPYSLIMTISSSRH